MIVRTERGWPGHFICANRCRFRRNTLLECGDTRAIVSTVGLQENPLRTTNMSVSFEEVGAGRYFETMVFHARRVGGRYWDADIDRQIFVDSPHTISEIDADDKANDMHEQVVKEVTDKIERGEIK